MKKVSHVKQKKCFRSQLGCQGIKITRPELDMVLVWPFLQPQGILLLLDLYQNLRVVLTEILWPFRYHIMMKHFNLKQNRAIDMINVYLRILICFTEDKTVLLHNSFLRFLLFLIFKHNIVLDNSNLQKDLFNIVE